MKVLIKYIWECSSGEFIGLLGLALVIGVVVYIIKIMDSK